MDKILNIEKAIKIFDYDVALYKELMNEFFKKYPKYMEEILNNIKDEKEKETTFTAHMLKGMLATLGAEKAEKAAFLLEKEKCSGNFLMLYEKLDMELTNLKEFFIKNNNLLK